MDAFIEHGQVTQNVTVEFDNCIVAIVNFGLLCQWKGQIFKAQGDKKEYCDWLQIAGNMYSFFFWPEMEDYTTQLHPVQYEDLILRMFYISCTICNLDCESGEGRAHSILELPLKFVTFSSNIGGFDQFVQRAVRRFSIPYNELAKFLGNFFKLKSPQDSSCNQHREKLITYRNTALINSYFLSHFTQDEK